jgi:4-amino-4-deoxy-L-arabinose transferase-like glycosyltransferase
MTLKSIDNRLLAVFGRLVEALCDPLRRHRTALVAAIIYALMWALYATIAKSSQGMNADLGETVVWARNLDWGFPKHPPLPALILAGWFAVFPLTDWAYYLLAGLNLGIGLYFSFVLAGLWLEGEKLVVAPFLLALVPFYNFLGLKFDPNSLLIPLWALTTWAFVQSFRHRHLGYAALAGFAAGASVLSKYWTVFLLLALAIAALCDRRRGAYLRSAAPWVTALIGAAIIAPHVIWLVRENFPPFNWVEHRRDAGSVAASLLYAVKYLIGTLAYTSLALGTFWVLVRPSAAAVRDILFPREVERRMAALIFWLPLLLPIVVAAATQRTLLALWNTESMALLPVVLLSSTLVVVGRIAAARIVGCAIMVAVLALLASPIVAAAKLFAGVENYALYVPAAVTAVEREWKAQTNQPLEIVAGPFTLTSSISFSLPDRPSTYADFSTYLSPWVNDQKLMRAGVAVICPHRDVGCLAGLEQLTKRRPAARRVEVELTPRWLGLAGSPDRFVIAILPPP